MKIDCICEICTKEFSIYPADVRKGGGHCCSVLCRNRRLAIASRVDATERFWNRVVKTEGCWLWTGGKTLDGYGQIRVNGRNVRANRFSWETHVGQIPSGMLVLHNCPDGDNPSCVNPQHLWLGTDADNSADRNSKQRQARGQKSGAAKLTDEIVRDVLSEYSSGNTTYRKLAAKYGVTNGTIQAIIEGRTWKHLPRNVSAAE